MDDQMLRDQAARDRLKQATDFLDPRMRYRPAPAIIAFC
jgi:hypothetical protein